MNIPKCFDMSCRTGFLLTRNGLAVCCHNVIAVWVAVVAAVVASPFHRLQAQPLPTDPVVAMLPMSTPLVIKISDIEAIASLLTPSAQEKLDTIWLLATEHPHPLIDSATAAEIRSTGLDLFNSITTMNAVYVVVHRWDDSDPQISLIVDAPDTTHLAELSVALGQFFSAVETFQQEGTPKEHDTSDDETADRGALSEPPTSRTASPAGHQEPLTEISRWFGGWHYWKLDLADRTLLIISNFEEAQELIRPDRSLRESLTSSRQWQTSQNFISGYSKRFQTVRIFAQPRYLHKLFSMFNDQVGWSGFGIEELPVASVAAGIHPNGSILARVLVKSTLPSSGIAEQWGSMVPLSHVAQVPFDWMSIEAVGLDRELYFNARQEFYDSTHGPGTYEQALAGRYGPVDDALIANIKSFADGRSQFLMLDDDGLQQLVSLHQIQQRDAAYAVAEAIAEQYNRGLAKKGLRLERFDSGDAERLIWRLPAGTDLKSTYIWAFAIVDEWVVEGNHDLVVELFEFAQQQPIRSVPPLELVPVELAPEVEAFQPSWVQQVRPEWRRFLNRYELIAHLVRDASRDPAIHERMKQIQSLETVDDYPIESQVDRMAVIRHKLHNLIIDQFGTVTTLFRPDESRFETIWILSK
ncbi:MAG TPA: hypothetical protein PKD64_19000 [Pirellulaceae bacterium]|nr:hypothetical protein [Pirellulaceae bacterium]HMO94279.1 hypothetical protein [Pirellulaceae bacterium]HMP70819.1 hypothetical protein [Pirellulaceae bacterium]